MPEINISIIVPVYNKECYIKECLSSILKQTYSNYEVIVIDDGSTDSSKERIEDFVRKDHRIKLYSFDNAGVAVARNRGLGYVRGKYILFIDADDWIESNYLEHIMIEVQRYSADLYLWGITQEFSDVKKKIEPIQNGLKDQKEFLTQFVEEQYNSRVGLYGYIANKLLKASLVKQYGLAFDKEVRLMEDYKFFLDYYAHCKQIYLFPEVGYHYIMGTMFSSLQCNKIVDYISLISVHLKCLDLLKKKNCLTRRNECYIQKALCDLSVASFLEMTTVRVSKIKHLLTFMKNSSVHTSLVVQPTRFKLLKKLILNQNSYIIYIYIQIWKSYLFLKKKMI